MVNRGSSKNLELKDTKIKMRIKDKKGMFFTLLVIAMLSLFLITYSSYSIIKDRTAIDKRISTMNSFVFSLEEDMSRQIYISAYRAILGIENYITSEGQFITDSKTAIEEALLNGTINGDSVGLMENYRLKDWSSRISNMSEKMNLLVNYSLKDVSVSQEDPWNVKVETKIELFIKDKAGLASWNRTSKIIAKVEIIDFEDPLYLIKTGGRVTNKINKTIYEPFVDGNDVLNLTLHVNNSRYIASSSAPSFLDRLEGKLTQNSNGIESLVNLEKLSAQGMAVEDKSIVDYIYFSDNNPAAYSIQGMPSWFRLDNESAHLEVYDVSHLAS